MAEFLKTVQSFAIRPIVMSTNPFCVTHSLKTHHLRRNWNFFFSLRMLNWKQRHGKQFSVSTTWQILHSKTGKQGFKRIHFCFKITMPCRSFYKQFDHSLRELLREAELWFSSPTQFPPPPVAKVIVAKVIAHVHLQVDVSRSREVAMEWAAQPEGGGQAGYTLGRRPGSRVRCVCVINS